MNQVHIIVVSGNIQQRGHAAAALKSIGYDVSIVDDVADVKTTSRVNAVVMVVGPQDLDTTEKIKTIRMHRSAPPVIIMDYEPTVEAAVNALHAGAADYLLAPLNGAFLKKSLDRCIDRNASQGASGGPSLSAQGSQRTIIYNNPAFEKVINMGRQVAPSMATVLISGESGTGKEVMARFVHANSRFAGGPYVALNCAALPENLAESELFGHEKGAFTGASSRKPGKFELANNGTLVLDEISEMPLTLQAKLLRVLQERSVDRIGGSQPVAVNTRVVAISNVDLRKAVKENRFREDLYYRINVIKLKIPPLRERVEDIPLLVDYFLEKFAHQNQMPPKKISPKALRHISAAPWPGNVRELENTIERAFLLTEGAIIEDSQLFLEAPLEMHDSKDALSVGMSVKEMEKELIFKTLENVNNNRTRAAEMLDISIRTLRNKLKEYEQAG